MKIINKYIAKQLVLGFVLVLVSMLALVWLMQSLKLIDMIVTKGVSIGVFLKLTFYVLPNFIQILSPLALFAVTLFVYTRMQSDKELMVMRAAGMDNKQLIRPGMMVAVVLVIIGYAMTLYLIPSAIAELREMRWKVRNNLSHLLLQEGQFNTLKDGLTVYVKERQGEGMVKGVLVYETDKKNGKASTMVAEDGVLFQENDEMQVVLNRGVRQEYDPKTDQFSILKFDKYTMVFADSGRGEKGSIGDPSELPIITLAMMPQSDKISPPLWRKYKVEALKRVIQPLYNITFLFLAVCGVLVGFYNRRGQMAQVNAAVVSAIVVQALALAFENMATRNLVFMPLMVLNILVPIFVVYLILFKGKKFTWRGKKWLGVLLMAVFLWGIPAMAASTALLKMKAPEVSKDKPVDFESDQISYDDKTGTMTAWGNVIIKQNDLILRTEKIIYDRARDTIKVPGVVTATLADGTVTTTDNMQMSADLKEAIAHGIQVRFFEGSRIAAENMKRTHGGEAVYLKNATYTPCDFCAPEDPLWRIRAREIKHDGAEHAISYKHAFLDAKGLPIFYFPYLQMPDFTVKRKTGFLMPQMSSGRDMGTAIGLPFFIDLADNQNLLLTPIISFTHAPLGLLDYEGRFKKGEFKFSGSLTQNDDTKNIEGHAKANLTYDINDDWRLSGQYFRVSNKTYFRRYHLDNIDDQQPFLYSDLTAERFGDKNYFTLSAYAFQDLHTNQPLNEIRSAAPMIDYRYQTDELWGGMYAFSNVNSAFIWTESGMMSDRISVEPGVRLPYISPFGMTADFIASIRADGYYVDSGQNGFIGVVPQDNYTRGRVYPNVSLELGYPMTYVSGSVTQVFEPILMGVWSTNSGNTLDIPNLDSLDFDFDDINLFSRNRFSGYDRVETGARMNYGVRWSLYDSDNRSMSAVFGQTYHLHEDEAMTGLMGTDARFSDYVGRVQVDYKDVSLAYRFRLSESDFSSTKNEINLWGGRDPLRVGIDYLYLDEIQTADLISPKREEISVYALSKLTKQWSAFGNYRYNLTDNGGPIEAGFALRYDNECLAVSLELRKSFAEDRDYKGDTSVMLKFILKTLGGNAKDEKPK